MLKEAAKYIRTYIKAHPNDGNLDGLYKECDVEMRKMVTYLLMKFNPIDRVSEVYDGMFESTEDLTSITIPNRIRNIGISSFADCIYLERVYLPKDLTSIGDSAFYDCFSLESITINDGIQNIGDDAFSGCSNLIEANIGEGLIELSESIFHDCRSLDTLVLPSTLKKISRGALFNCSRISSIIFRGTVDQWIAVDKGPDWDYNTDVVKIKCSDGIAVSRMSGGVEEWIRQN